MQVLNGIFLQFQYSDCSFIKYTTVYIACTTT
jgi:hypothetical protein